MTRPRGACINQTRSHLWRGHRADVFSSHTPLSSVIFGLIILFGAVEVALSTWLVNWYDNRSYPSHSYRDRIRFTCFVSWWTLVFAIAYLVFYQIAATSIISSVASHAGWLFLTWIFWTAAAASVTAMLGGGLDCGRDYVNCSQLNALEGAPHLLRIVSSYLELISLLFALAFAWILWILFTVATVSVIGLAFRSYRRGDKFSGSLA